MAVGVAAEVKSKLGVADVVGETVQLKKAGSTFKGLCPFHGEKTPSFTVTPARDSWKCFGCGEGGDIFSFGVMLHEMLGGARPFDGETAVDTMQAILREDAPDLPSTVPAGVRQVVSHCLEKDPAHRFQSARDLGFALRALAQGDSSSGAAEAVPSPVPAAKLARPWLWAGAALLMIAATALTHSIILVTFNRRDSILMPSLTLARP